jgi:hypothetical protein
MAFLGGVGTISGPVLGALILEPAQQNILTSDALRDYYPVIYGALFLFVILLLPRGIIPTIGDYWNKFRLMRTRRRGQADDLIVTPLQALDSGVEGGERSILLSEANIAQSERKEDINL